MKLLVCGGAGFIGSHFVRYILDAHPDYEVVVFDKLTYAGNMTNLAPVVGRDNFVFVQGDIADSAAVNAVFLAQQVDAVLNYAAETHVDRSILDPEAFLRTDVLGVYHLLEAVKKFGVSKYIQVSTDEVYGSIAQGAFTEDSPFHPNSPYAASKAGGDHLCRAYFETYRTPVVVTHSCNVYGPYQYPEKFIPLFITNLLEDKKVPLYGDGKTVREWLYALDHCQAIDLALHYGQPGGVYNIGSGVERQNKDLAAELLRLLGQGPDMIERIADRPGHDRRYAIDHSKITRELGWQPATELAEGLRQTVEWYTHNQAWWKKIKNGEYLAYYQRQYGV